MNFNFYAYLNRMKYIKRWALMHSTVEENIMEHTQQVTVITHSLCLIKNTYFGGKVDIEKALLYATYHETSEVVTGDLPTPIKYFNKAINGAYKDLERGACEKLLTLLPEELSKEYAKSVLPDTDSEEYKIMKCADRISAYIKCVEELKSGNKEFALAEQSILRDIQSIDREEVKYFIENILPSYSLTLDEF